VQKCHRMHITDPKVTAATKDFPQLPSSSRPSACAAANPFLYLLCLTVLYTVCGVAAGASPAGYGPSPVMPIKLDSLWTPGTAQHTSSSPYAAFSPLAAPQGTPEAQDIGLAQDNSTVDLASMFISTPAAAPGSSSPIEGVIAADEAPAAAAAPATEPIAARPQQETPSANDSVLMGSPAPPGAFAFVELAPAAGRTPGSPAALPPAGSRATPEPSAPLLPQGQPGTAAIPGTPGWSQDTDLPPARSPSFDTQAGATPGARATPGSVRGPAPKSAAKRTPGGTARKSGTSGLSPSPLQDSSPMPPAGPPVLSDMESPIPPAGPPVLSDMESPMPPAGPPVLSDMESPMPPAGETCGAQHLLAMPACLLPCCLCIITPCTLLHTPCLVTVSSAVSNTVCLPNSNVLCCCLKVLAMLFSLQKVHHTC
jgi:hypothetical protein